MRKHSVSFLFVKITICIIEQKINKIMIIRMDWTTTSHFSYIPFIPIFTLKLNAM